MLWTLVSKEPPAPADETRGAGHDRGQKAGLSLNWAVPNVTVKDVPNFEMLSPELETGIVLPPALAPLARAQHAGLGPGTCPGEDSSQEEDVTHFSEHLPSARCGAPTVGLSVFLTCFTDEKTEAQRGEGTRQGLKARSGRIQTQVCF